MRTALREAVCLGIVVSIPLAVTGALLLLGRVCGA
jgi:hypothetical protein